jgi:hypothetical protein
MDAVLKLLEKYANVPMSLAVACHVRITETLNDVLLTTDADLRLYRRHGGQIIACILPRRSRSRSSRRPAIPLWLRRGRSQP